MIPPFLYKWIAIAVVIIGLTAALIWERHEVKVARESQAVAERQAAISATDAERWQKASGDRDAEIGQYRQAAIAQNEIVANQVAAKKRADDAAAAAIAEAAKVQTAADQRIKEIEDEARAKPQDVRSLGPIVLRRVDELFD